MGAEEPIGSILSKFYLNVYNEMNEGQESGRSLCTFTSQFTGKSKTVSLNTGYDNPSTGPYNQRYVFYYMWTVRQASLENLIAGTMQMGTTDFPLGLYDTIIYNNTDNTNLDPTGLPILWKGLMNLSSYYKDTRPVTYTEYSSNDGDTNSIYLTNTVV